MSRHESLLGELSVLAFTAIALSAAAGCSGTVENSGAAGLGAQDAAPDTHVGQGGHAGQAAGAGGKAGAGGSAGKGGEAGSQNKGGSGGAAGGGGQAGSAGTGGAPVRTIITRDLYDKYDTPDNLMADGTFELSGGIATIWGSAVNTTMEYGNGAVCRTGLRCAAIRPAEGIYGYYVSPESGSVAITIHTSPVNGGCNTLNVYAFDAYDSTAGNLQVLNNVSANLGPDGWCVVQGQVDAMVFKVPVLYLESMSDRVMVDDILALPAAMPAGQKLMSVPHAISPALLNRARKAAQAARERAMPWHTPRFRPSAPWTTRTVPWLKRGPTPARLVP